MLCLFLLAGLGRDGYSSHRAVQVGVRCAALFLGGYLAGAVIAPAFLPWLPGRAFSTKGAWAGFAAALAAVLVDRPQLILFANALDRAAWMLIIPAVASFLAMNFTGASTYTSLSGVKREMRRAVPLQITGAGLGLAIWVAARFVV